MSAQEMTTERLAAIRAELDACIDGGRGFLWGPCHPEGGFDSPEEASAYVANLVRRSVEAADDEGAAKRARELWGVFVNREDESLFVCHTGNGPTSEAHARFIAGAPYSVHSLLDHVDALTADRDEARQEVAALRAQRDEIREVHRVETAALAARLEAAERERGELRAEVVTLRADLEEWRRSHREAESLADQAKRRRERTLETVEARADAAEAKLAALVEAVERFSRVALGTPGYFDAVGALYEEDELRPIVEGVRGP